MPEALLPIVGLIRRELVSSLRTARYFYLVLIAVIFATMSVMVMWPRAQAMPYEMAYASESMFVALTLVLAGGAALAVPALSGSSIVSEREEATFELLAMTRAKPWHVITAKLANAAGHYLLLLIALAPLVAAAFFLVGINIDNLWKSLLLLSSTALACAAAGVLCSCMVDKPIAAVGLSYLAMLTIVGFPLLLLLVVAEVLGVQRIDPFLTNFGVYVMPMFAYMVSVGDGPGGLAARRPVEICSALCLVLTVVLVVIAHLAVRKHWGEAAEISGPDEPRAQEEPRESRRHTFSESLNPQYQREIWFEFPLRGWIGFLIAGVPFGLSLLACLTFIGVSWANNDNETRLIFFAWQYLQAVLLPMLFIAIMGNLFTKEAERSNLDALRVSLLTADEVSIGKLMSSLRVAAIMFGMAILGMAPLVFVSPLWIDDGIRILIFSTIMLAICLLTAWSVTAFCSIVSARMASALVLSFMVSAMVLIGFALILLTIHESLRERLLGNDKWIGLFSPYFSTGFIAFPNNRSETAIWITSMAVSLLCIGFFLVQSFRSFRKSYREE